MSGVDWESVWAEAQDAAAVAAEACVPRPMVVGDAIGLSDEIDYSKPTYYVAGGVCGFAGVKIRPARGKLVSELKKKGIGRRDDYAGGYYVSSYDLFRPAGALVQSYEINCAIAGAAAEVLRSYGVDAHVESRLD